MYNAGRTILDTLRGLEAQAETAFEVVVVDDGSQDGSAQIVQDFGRHSHLNLKLLSQPNAGPARARNLGAAHSRGEVVLFLDADCVPPHNWLGAMVAPLSDGMVGCNCGYQVKNSESLIARYVDCEIAWRHQRLRGKDIDTLGSYSLSLSRQAFEEVGGFNTSYREANAEDFDLGFKIRGRGYRLFFTGDTFVYHVHPSSLKKYLRQQFRRGYWRVKMYQENRGKIIKGDSYTGYEPQLQFLLVILFLHSLPLAFFYPPGPLLTAALLVFSNLPLGLWACRREKKFLVLAPLLASLRSIAGTFGVYHYLWEKLIRVRS